MISSLTVSFNVNYSTITTPIHSLNNYSVAPYIDPLNISVVRKGEDATLICRSSGKPRPELVWKFQNRTLSKLLIIYWQFHLTGSICGQLAKLNLLNCKPSLVYRWFLTENYQNSLVWPLEWPQVWKSDSDGIQNGMNKSNDYMCMIFNVHVDQFCNDPGYKVIRL